MHGLGSGVAKSAFEWDGSAILRDVACPAVWAAGDVQE
jgi:hypothetical protein